MSADTGAFCAGPDWTPGSGTCGACGLPLDGRSRWFCHRNTKDRRRKRRDKHGDLVTVGRSNANLCEERYLRNHRWTLAKRAVLRRDGGCVRPACVVKKSDRHPGGSRAVEVNHVEPRAGQGYQLGCHNHLDNLETLCRTHHLEETKRQREERKQQFLPDDTADAPPDIAATATTL